jgi:hypothetical protein
LSSSGGSRRDRPFCSIADPQAAINAYVAEHNANAILAKLDRFPVPSGIEMVAEYKESRLARAPTPLDRRPQLAAALGQARKAKCPVVVAKLDRLSRDVHFTSGLMSHRVPLIVAELGDGTPTRSCCTCMPRSRKRSGR